MLRLGFRHAWRAHAAVLGALATLVTACERPEPVPGRKDTAIAVAPPPDSGPARPPAPPAWDTSAGPALFVVGTSPSEAVVIAAAYTDSASLDTTRIDSRGLRVVQVDLFAAGRRAGVARVAAVTPPVRSDSCSTWPVARLAPTITDSAAFSSWSVAFQSGHASEVALDSIEALPTADSSRLAVDIARIASALPGDTAALFRGLPFVVKKAWRSRGLQPQVLAAIVVRNVNQEANPRQEQLLLITERDTTTPSARYAPVYHERVTGLEETIETTDLIGMVLLGEDRRPTVVVARDAATGSSYALIERIGGQWRRRWTSIYAGC
jgi:hypothetical protein